VPAGECHPFAIKDDKQRAWSLNQLLAFLCAFDHEWRIDVGLCSICFRNLFPTFPAAANELILSSWKRGINSQI
jgi:hypothetical protein